VILFGLFVAAIYILLRPAIQAAEERRRERQRPARKAHEAVLLRLDASRRPPPKDDPGEGRPDGQADDE